MIIVIYIPHSCSVQAGRHRQSNFGRLTNVFCATEKNIKILFVNCFNLFVKSSSILRHLNKFEIIPLFFNSHGYLALLIKMNETRTKQDPYKNHFNFRLHVEIDTIKQTDKNNDHIHRNKTNKPVNLRLHNFTGNTHFCTYIKCHCLGMKPFLEIWTAIILGTPKFHFKDFIFKTWNHWCDIITVLLPELSSFFEHYKYFKEITQERKKQ